eukprot:gene13379-biopygen15579
MCEMHQLDQVFWASPVTCASRAGRPGKAGRAGQPCRAGQPGRAAEGGSPRTVARAWRGHGADVARDIGIFWAWVARAWHGRGADMSCDPRVGTYICSKFRDPQN